MNTDKYFLSKHLFFARQKDNLIPFSVVFFVSFFSLIFTTHAKSLLPPKTHDSLYNVWTNPRMHDTARLNAIYRICVDGYLDFDVDSANHYATLMYDFAKTKGLKKYIALSFLSRGLVYSVSGDNTRAIESFNTALRLNLQIKNYKGAASAYSNIGIAYQFKSYYDSAIDNHNKSLKIYEKIKDKKGIAVCYTNLGVIYDEIGDYPKSLDYYLKSLKILEELNIKKSIGNILSNIGVIYSRLGNNSKALEYYNRGLKIREEINDIKGISTCLLNIGIVYNSKGEYQQALKLYQKSLKYRIIIKDKRLLASSYINIAELYFETGDIAKSMENYNLSLKYYEEIDDLDGISSCYIGIGQLKNKLKEHKQAKDWCSKGLKISEEIGTTFYQIEACNCLYDAYKALGDRNNALIFLEKLGSLKDKMKDEETATQLERMEFQKAMIKDSIAQVDKARRIDEAHKEEVRKKNRTRNILIGGGFILLILSGSFYSRWRYVRKSKAALQVEKDRSENLLLNILPEEIAAELKEKGKADARDFEMVSILFTDFKGFTEQSAKMTPAALVNEINHCFEAFDKIMEKYGIEKIKTIGDAYMAAGGLPVPTDDSVKNTVFAAIEMQDFIKNRKTEKDALGEPAFEMRVGIHTGPVVAGIVGVKKFQYDIWGDTVNTASRMESNGEAGKVNISQSTFELLKNEPLLSFEERGKISAKGKGDIDMWFVYKKNA